MRTLSRSMAIAPLAVAVALFATPAAAQHHPPTGKVDYDPDPGGGDPNVPAGCPGAANKIVISGNATTFSPATITVDEGQPVCWTWSTDGVSHNLKADDNSFSSGQPASSGTFQRTFTTAGTFGYYCQVHGSTTGGMRGTVVVRETEGEGGGSGPGTLSINPGAYTVDENGGSVVLIVERTGGSDGKVTVKIGTGTGSATKAKDFLPRNSVLTWNSGDGSPKTFSVTIKNDTATEPDETFAVTLTKPTGSATIGTSSATVTIQDDEGCPSSALLAPAGVKASGQSAREVRVSWGVDTLVAKTMHVERRGNDGDFREVAALPAGAGEYADAGLPSGATFQYRLRAESAAGLSEYSEIAAAATDGSIGACASGAHALCLAGGRFEAKVTSRRGEGEPPRAAVRGDSPAAARSGLFALTSSGGDAELMLKVVDGCAENGHYWVQLAAVTDAELAVSVRDTQTGRTWAFFNPAGKAAGAVRDVDAFATCP